MSEKSKNILLGVLIVGLVSMTVAYAALSTTLTINGTASIPETKWDIRITDWAADYPSTITKANNATMTNTASETTAASVAATSISNLAVRLNQPGDKAVYKFKIANYGTIGAKLASNLSTSCTIPDGQSTTNCPDYINYEVTCTSAATAGQTLAARVDSETPTKTEYCYLSVEYVDQTTSGAGSTYTQNAVTATFGAQWVYEQQ